MAITRRTKWIAATLIVAALLIVGTGFVHHFRPLLHTADWRISVEASTGKAGEATVYRMLGRANVLFIKLQDPPDENYRWFSIDTKNQIAALPNWPDEKPYLHFNHDMAIGVGLDDGKVDDGWTITWNGDELTFSNGRLAVTLERTKG